MSVFTEYNLSISVSMFDDVTFIIKNYFKLNINTIFMESKSSLKLLLPDVYVYLSAVDHSRPGNKLLQFI